MMLQPFVENAVIHGVKQKENAVILLSAKADGPDYVVITISDNGCGMDPKTLKQVEYWLKTRKKSGRVASEFVMSQSGCTISLGKGRNFQFLPSWKKGRFLPYGFLYPPSEKRDDGENEIEF